MNLTPEQMKARSQNLGHSDVLKTFTSYGKVPMDRQGELIRGLEADRNAAILDDPDILALIRKIRAGLQIGTFKLKLANLPVRSFSEL